MWTHSCILICCLAIFIGLVVSDDFQNYKNPPFFDNRNVIVHLTDMLYEDIGVECQEFLSVNTYAAVQVSPVTEFEFDPSHPWDERINVSSYKISNASGNEEEFIKMVNDCNNVNVRVLVDVVLNNMGRSQQNKNEEECAVCGSQTTFGPSFFHEPYTASEYTYRSSKFLVWKSMVGGRRDLYQVKPNGMVNWKIVQFLTRLIEIGVAGFRVLLADHMDPSELLIIYNSLPDLSFAPGKRPFIYHDVYNPLQGYEYVIQYKDYSSNTRVTDYRYAHHLALMFLHRKKSLSEYDSRVLNFVPNSDAVVFNFNFQTRALQTRTLTPYPILKERFLDSNDDKAYKLSTLFMLSSMNDVVLLTSTPRTGPNKTQGPFYSGNRVALFGGRKKDEGSWLNGWYKKYWYGEHRWNEICTMVQFHNSLRKEATLPKIDNYMKIGFNDYAISYCIGNKGFVIINLSGYNLYSYVQTCFDKGIYCDLLSGGATPSKTRCYGQSIPVNLGGGGYPYLAGYIGMFIFHIDHKLK